MNKSGTNTLEVRDGQVFLVAHDADSSEPIMFHRWYRLGVGAYSLCTYDTHKIGMDVRTIDAYRGQYQDADGMRWYLPIDRTNEYHESEPIPCPRVRANTETRWYCGAWEKYTKYGWIAI